MLHHCQLKKDCESGLTDKLMSDQYLYNKWKLDEENGRLLLSVQY